jgi:hypothetical protein
MVSVIISSVVDPSLEPLSGQTKDYKMCICCFSAHNLRERAKTGWLGIRIMCPSVVICLSAGCCFSELAL